MLGETAHPIQTLIILDMWPKMYVLLYCRDGIQLLCDLRTSRVSGYHRYVPSNEHLWIYEEFKYRACLHIATFPPHTCEKGVYKRLDSGFPTCFWLLTDKWWPPVDCTLIIRSFSFANFQIFALKTKLIPKFLSREIIKFVKILPQLTTQFAEKRFQGPMNSTIGITYFPMAKI